MGKWFLAFGLLIVAIITAFTIFAVSGVLDAPALFWQLGLKISWLEPHLQIYAQGQDAETWLKDQEAQLAGRAGEIEGYAQDLRSREEQLEQLAQELARQETDLKKRRADFAEELAARRNIKRLAEIYSEMPPEEGARILEKAQPELVLQILSWMDERDAARILALLPTGLAVTLSNELKQRPDEE